MGFAMGGCLAPETKACSTFPEHGRPCDVDCTLDWRVGLRREEFDLNNMPRRLRP